MTRRSYRSARDVTARALFRQAGFRVESVPFIRARNEEFMAIVVWPASDTGEVVNWLLNPKNVGTEISRIHIGNQDRTARIYIRWTTPDPRVATTWEQIEEALRREGTR